MLNQQSVSSRDSLEHFCQRISKNLHDEGFSIDIQPGVHLVDDAGADSLMVFYYVLQLQELGLPIDLAAFDTDLLDIDVAYNEWIRSSSAVVNF